MKKRSLLISIIAVAMWAAMQGQGAFGEDPPPVHAPEADLSDEAVLKRQKLVELQLRINGVRMSLADMQQRLADIGAARGNKTRSGEMGAGLKGPLLNMLSSADPAVRVSAAESLMLLGLPWSDIKEPLFRLLADEVPEVRASVAEGFRTIDVPLEEVKDALLRLLRDTDDEVRVQALRSLVSLRVPAADIERRLWTEYDRQTLLPPIDIIKAFAELNIPAERVKRDLMRELSNRDWLIQKFAMRGLAILKVPYPEVRNFLEKKLDDRNVQIRLSAIRAILVLGPPAGIAGIIQARLNDRFEEVRMEAIDGLSRLGLDPEAVKQRLIEKLEDESETVQRAAITALNGLDVSLDDVRDTLMSKLESKSSLMRLEIVRCLLGHNISDPRMRDILMRLLDEGSEESIRFLAEMGVSDDAFRDALVSKLGSDDLFMRIEAVRALKAMNSSADGLDAMLAGFLKEDNQIVQELAIEVMIESGMPVEQIAGALRSKTDVVNIVDALDKVAARRADRERRRLRSECLRQRAALEMLLAEEKQLVEEAGLSGEGAVPPPAPHAEAAAVSSPPGLPAVETATAGE